MYEILSDHWDEDGFECVEFLYEQRLAEEDCELKLVSEFYILLIEDFNLS